jgi:hypothetical protein
MEPAVSAARKSSPATMLAPMSATAAQLLHQLVQDAADAAAPAPGSIVLQPQTKLQHQERYSSDHHFVAYSADNSTSIRWVKHPTTSLPQWLGRENRRDAEGRSWERTMWGIVDDFGTLVEVSL